MYLNERQLTTFVDLLIEKTDRLEQENEDLKIRAKIYEERDLLKAKAEQNQKNPFRPSHGTIADLMGVNRNDVERTMVEETFKAPRNLSSEVGYDANGSEA